MSSELSEASLEADSGIRRESVLGSANLHGDEKNGEDDGDLSKEDTQKRKAATLPDDLPKSLDDRRSVPIYAGETEMYDAWQGVIFVYYEVRCLFNYLLSYTLFY
jgi:hypothetical protein